MAEQITSLEFIIPFGDWVRDCEVPYSWIEGEKKWKIEMELGIDAGKAADLLEQLIDSSTEQPDKKQPKGKKKIDYGKLIQSAKKLLPSASLWANAEFTPKADLKKCLGKKMKRNIVWGGVWLKLEIGAKGNYGIASGSAKVNFDGWIIYERETCECVEEESHSSLTIPNPDGELVIDTPTDYLASLIPVLAKSLPGMSKRLFIENIDVSNKTLMTPHTMSKKKVKRLHNR